MTAKAEKRAAPLYSEDAEQAVLSAVFMDNAVALALQTTLAPDDFYVTKHRLIYGAIGALLVHGSVIDPLTLAHQLETRGELEAAGGKDFLGWLVDFVPTAANVEYHASIVRETADRRKLVRTLEEATQALVAGAVTVREAATALQSSLLPIAIDETRQGYVHVADDLWPMMADLEERAAGKKLTNAIVTGYPEIDGPMGGGIQRGELVFLAGAPGGLKSATAMNIGVNVMEDSEGKVGVGVVSAEMKRWKLHARNMARMARVPFTQIRNAKIHDEDWTRLSRAAGIMARWPLWVDETPLPTLADAVAKSRHLKSKHPEIGLIVVDFIQLMQRTMTSREEENRALELTAISYGLAALGKELDAAVIALCQVDASKVEARESKKPKLGDLRWSQGMREAGDFIGLCYRHQTYFPNPMEPDNLELEFAKARDAEPFVATLNWIGQFMHLDSPLRRAKAA